MEKIKKMGLQAGHQNGCRLYDFYRHRDRLQFFIDKPNQEVSLHDCENVLHSLRFLIRSEFPEILEQKKLEVSTPGLEKTLREAWHFQEALNAKVRVVTISPVFSVNKKTNKKVKAQSVVGQLISFSPEELVVKDSLRDWHIPISKVKQAQCVFTDSKNQKNKFKKRRGKK